jgi:TRAP-type C4-dicarboxylate transport system permease small subunit
MTGVRKLKGALRAIESGILVAALAAMIGVAAWQVIARNLFDTGLLWGDGFVRVLVLWVAMVGAMIASRNDEHIRMDVLARFVSPAVQRQLKRFACADTSAVLFVFAWYSLQFVRVEYEYQTIAFGGVPGWICEAVMPVAGLVIAVRYLLHVVDPP